MDDKQYNFDSSMTELKKDTHRLVRTFKTFVEEYKTALSLLIDSVNELEVIAEEIVQNSSECDKNKGG